MTGPDHDGGGTSIIPPLCHRRVGSWPGPPTGRPPIGLIRGFICGTVRGSRGWCCLGWLGMWRCVRCRTLITVLELSE